ncbi:MAG: DUF4260 domain-containing protein [Paludibaculum sp.]
MNPRPLLHLEGAAVLVLSLYAYQAQHASWGLFALLLLVPDLSMLGYLVNARAGAQAYNAVHTYVGPLLLALYSVGAHPALLPLALIWLAHIGMDRMLGYGLKYPTHFKDTHLSPGRHALVPAAAGLQVVAKTE